MADVIKYVSIDKLGYYDQKIKSYINDADTTLKDNLEGQVEVVAKAMDEEIARAKLAEQANATAAANAQAAADGVSSYVGTFTASDGVDTVVKYIDAKTANIASEGTVTALAERVTQAETDIDNIQKDYLKAADKTELQGKIDAKVAQTDYDAKMEEIDGDIDGLQTQINTIMNNPDAEGAINSINEFTKYVTDHGTIADGFRTDIDKNKEDITAEVKRAGDAESALSGRLDTLEAIDHDAYVAADTALKNELTTEIGKKADASALTSAVQTLEAADTELSGKISALEAKFGDGEGSVGGMISDAMDAEEARVDGLLDKKVDKVDGKGLSTNDLTDELKGNYDAAYAHSQVAHAPADAQANLIESVKVNGTALTITGKAVDIAVPTDNAQLANGAGYLVANDIANKADKGTTLAEYGISDTYTSAQTDAAIANAMAQFEECTQDDINALFA